MSLRRAGAALLVLALAGTGSGQPAAQKVYRIQAGDSLYRLARASGVSTLTLEQLNGLPDSRIRVGQVIRLPVKAGDGEPAQVAPLVAPSPAEDPGTASVFQQGMAVYYGGRQDSRTPLTAAHLTLPFGTWVEVRHVRTGRSVLVLINDRGPFGQPERVIDLSAEAARVLGIVGEGVAPVTLRIARTP